MFRRFYQRIVCLQVRMRIHAQVCICRPMQEKVKPRKDSRTQLYVIPIYKLCGRHELLYSSVYGQLYRGDDVHARLEK